jgi:cytochrome P450
MDEILFANIDVSAAVLCTMLVKLASHSAVQEFLRSEIRSQQLHDQDDIGQYIVKQDTMLHRVVMESMRFSPAFGKI